MFLESFHVFLRRYKTVREARMVAEIGSKCRTEIYPKLLRDRLKADLAKGRITKSEFEYRLGLVNKWVRHWHASQGHASIEFEASRWVSVGKGYKRREYREGSMDDQEPGLAPDHASWEVSKDEVL